MPCLIRRLTQNALEPVEMRAASLAEAAAFEPRDGVYTIANTFDGEKVLKLDAHLDRLEDSARRAGFALKLDRARLRAALRAMLRDSGFGNARFRITVSAASPQDVLLSLEPFQPLPERVYADGVRVITAPGAARHDPAAKTTDWMHDRRQIEGALPPGIFTALLLSPDGALLEGVSSNFYAVLDGALCTAAEGVLPGVAQQIVLEIAPDLIPIRRVPVSVRDLPALDEAFITSSSRGIVPVIEIDGIVIGSGVPGPITRALWDRYRSWLASHLEPL